MFLHVPPRPPVLHLFSLHSIQEEIQKVPRVKERLEKRFKVEVGLDKGELC